MAPPMLAVLAILTSIRAVLGGGWGPAMEGSFQMIRQIVTINDNGYQSTTRDTEIFAKRNSKKASLKSVDFRPKNPDKWMNEFEWFAEDTNGDNRNDQYQIRVTGTQRCLQFLLGKNKKMKIKTGLCSAPTKNSKLACGYVEGWEHVLIYASGVNQKRAKKVKTFNFESQDYRSPCDHVMFRGEYRDGIIHTRPNIVRTESYLSCDEDIDCDCNMGRCVNAQISGECSCNGDEIGIIMIGRPYTGTQGDYITSDAVYGDSSWATEKISVDTSGLNREEMAVLASEWTASALGEHASVASFSRFSIELMATQAPPNLLKLASQAAMDEIRHAQVSFSIASVFQGMPVGPGPFPAHDTSVTNDLASVISRVLKEAVIGESIAAVVASRKAELAEGSIKEALSTIAREEATHADLAMATLQWALSVDPEGIRELIRNALPQSCDPALPERPEDFGSLARYGVLDAEAEKWVRAEAMETRVAPRLRQLIGVDGAVARQCPPRNATAISTTPVVVLSTASV